MDTVQRETPLITLRDYQESGIEDLRDAYRQGNRAPLYQLATGGGKTVVFSRIVSGAAAKGIPTLVLAHRRELIRQASANLTWAGVKHGIQAAGMDRDHHELVQVGSIQSVVKRLDKLPKFGLIVADEGHHCVSATWSKLLASQPDAKWLAVTATPQRLDGKGLGKNHGGPFDALVCGPTTQWLVDQGYLAPLKVYLPAAAIDVKGLRKVAGDYVADELAERAEGVTGDAVAEFAKLPAGTTALAFCATVKHAQDVAGAFTLAGFRAACIHGETPKAERDEAIASIGDGRLDVLTSCEVISEGLDVPSVGCVILLRPTESLVMAFQQIGRGMRPKPDGSALVVLDHARNCLKHGLPTEEIAWSLDGAPKKDPNKQPPERWVCFECSVLNPPGRRECSSCGAPKSWICPERDCRHLNSGHHEICTECYAVRPRRRILVADNGEMVEYEPGRFDHITQMSYHEFLSKPRTEAELRAYAKAKGYKRGWVFWRMKEQQQMAEQMARRVA